MRPRVMVVEDDQETAATILTILREKGFEGRVAGSVAAARTVFAELKPAVVVLDLVLPGAGGKVYCRELAARSDVGIIVASSIGTASERISLLELGADDYIVKPFEPLELIARLRSLIRRRSGTPVPIVGRLAGKRFDPSARRIVHGDGRVVHLTQAQTEVLRYLMQNAGRVVSRDEILAVARTRQYAGGVDRSVDRVISRLRQKVEDEPRSPRHIISVYGSGYMFAATGGPDDAATGGA